MKTGRAWAGPLFFGDRRRVMSMRHHFSRFAAHFGLAVVAANVVAIIVSVAAAHGIP
jgi:hypothetical protein